MWLIVVVQEVAASAGWLFVGGAYLLDLFSSIRAREELYKFDVVFSSSLGGYKVFLFATAVRRYAI